MSPFATAVAFLVAHGGALALGASLVLAAGVAAVAAARTSALRRWLGTVAAGAAAVYLIAAVVPLPRVRVAEAAAAPRPAVDANVAPAGPPGPAGPAATGTPVGPDGPGTPGMSSAAERSASSPASTSAAGAARVPPDRVPGSMHEPPTAAAPAVTRDATDGEALGEAPGEAPGGEAPGGEAPGEASGEALGEAPGEASGEASGEAPGDAAATWASLFLAGAALVLLHRLLGVARLAHVVRRSDAAPAALAVAVALPPGATVRIARAAVRPFAFGVRRGGIVLPPELAHSDAHATAVAVLRHEAAHLRAGDPRVQLLFAALAVPLYWHPLFWWLRRQVRLHSELLADSAAAERDLSGYVRSMLALAAAAPRATGTRAGAAAGAGAVFVFHRPSEFYRRLHMLLSRDVPLSPHLARSARWLPAVSAALLAACCAAVLGATPLGAQEPPPGTAREEALVAQIRTLQQRIDELQAILQRQEPARGGSEYAPGAPTDDDSRVLPLLESLFQRRNGSQDHVVDVVVQKGDSLQVLVQRVNHSVTPELLERVRQLNPDLVPERLRVGQCIRIPVATGAPPAEADASTDQPPAQAPDQPPAQAPDQPPVQPPAAGSDPRLVDLLAIATRCIELRGEVEVAKVRIEVGAARVAAGQTEALEQRVAEIRLRTLEQQLRVAEQLVAGEREALQQRLKVLQQMHANGLATAQDVQRVGSFVEVLMGAF